MFRIAFFLIISLTAFNTNLYSQQKNLSKKEITKLLYDAQESLDKGDFEKSLILSRSTLKYSILLKNNNLIANSYNFIGANFYEITEIEKALFYYKKSLIYAEKTKNDPLINQIYNNLGNIYCFDKKEYKKGIPYYLSSLHYSRINKDSSQIFFTKLNIVWAYFDVGNYTDGYPHLQFINKHNSKYGIESTIAITDMLNAMYYDYKKDTKKADYHFNKAIKNALKYDENSDLSSIHQEYAKFLFKIKNFEAAYNNLNTYDLITKKINLEEKAKKAKIAGINLEIDEYKREIDKMGLESKKREQLFHTENERKNKMTTIILSLFLISLILFYFFYQNTKLKQKNIIKDIQNKINQNIINASIDGQENERKKIALFLHDTISASLSSAGMHLNVFLSQHSSLPPEITKTKLILDETHDKVRDLSHDLIPTLLARFGLLYALDDLCEKYSNSTLHFEYQNTIPIKKRYTEKFETRLYFIISELLNNIIKHSQASKAEVSLIENNNEMIIEITDNGKGFDTNKFNFVEGFGLNQIKARINNLDGQFDVKSKINEGTSVMLSVPLNG